VITINRSSSLILDSAFNGLNSTPPILDKDFDAEGNVLEVFEHGTSLNGGGISEGGALVGDGGAAGLAESARDGVAAGGGRDVFPNGSSNVEVSILNEDVG